jgi:hypothetical protein
MSISNLLRPEADMPEPARDANVKIHASELVVSLKVI